MSFYPEKVNSRIGSSRNAGKAIGANAVGSNGCFSCGGVLRLSLRIDIKTKEILDAKFQTNGCGYMIASADVLAEQVKGKKLTESAELKQENLQMFIFSELGGIAPERSHCLKICIETFSTALADFRAYQLESFQGEKVLICTCFGVSEEEIESIIRKNLPENVDEVTQACNAGGGCGSCRPLIQELLDAARIEPIY